MEEYVVTYTITGQATAIVRAESLDEARAKAKRLDVSDGEIIEWAFDDVIDVEPNR